MGTDNDQVVHDDQGRNCNLVRPQPLDGWLAVQASEQTPVNGGWTAVRFRLIF